MKKLFKGGDKVLFMWEGVRCGGWIVNEWEKDRRKYIKIHVVGKPFPKLGDIVALHPTADLSDKQLRCKVIEIMIYDSFERSAAHMTVELPKP